MRAFIAVIASFLCCLAVSRAAAAPPNVVLILSDDQAWNDYSFMGHEHIRTPHIDKLASQGVTYTRGYVPDSLCRPSLMTIITGLYPHQHGVVGNDPPVPEGLKGKPYGDPRYIEARNEYLKHIDPLPTIPKLLTPLGYVSHQSGKWWEGNYSRGGFTAGMTHGDRARGGRHGDDGLAIGRQGIKPVTNFIDAAVKDGKPFFVWYAPMMPHTPHTPPKRLLDKYVDKAPTLSIAKYWAMCEWFDETVGELLDHVHEKGLDENTIVLYVCDNGWINQPNASAYAPRSKRSQYDGGTRTPIIVRWPGKVQPRMDKTHLASSIDLAPTVLAACGLAPPKSMPGLNLLDENAVAQRDTIYGEILEHDIQHMTDPAPSLRYRWVIQNQWKLIVPNPPRVGNEPVELFDLMADPFETKNLAAANGDVVKRLTASLDEWWSPTAK